MGPTTHFTPRHLLRRRLLVCRLSNALQNFWTAPDCETPMAPRKRVERIACAASTFLRDGTLAPETDALLDVQFREVELKRGARGLAGQRGSGAAAALESDGRKKHSLAEDDVDSRQDQLELASGELTRGLVQDAPVERDDLRDVGYGVPRKPCRACRQAYVARRSCPSQVAR